MTLNYDTLLERSFGEIEVGLQGGSPDYLGIQLLYPISFQATGALGPSHCPTAELLKLHGSVNWLYSGRSEYFGEPIHYRWTNRWSSRELDEPPRTSRVPLIVAPMADKLGYFENEEIRFIWRRASEAIQNANRIFCVGYSLPVTDLTFRFLLHESQPEAPIPLYIVNEPSNEGACIAKHYEQYLPREGYILKDTFVAEESVKKLSDWLCKELTNAAPRGSEAADGPVRQRLLELLSATDTFRTYRGETFTAKASASGICITIGDDEIPACFPWAALEGIPQAIDEGRGDFPMEGAGFRPERRTLDSCLKRFVNRSTARWIGVLLRDAGLIVIDQRGPNLYVSRGTASASA